LCIAQFVKLFEDIVALLVPRSIKSSSRATRDQIFALQKFGRPGGIREALALFAKAESRAAIIPKSHAARETPTLLQNYPFTPLFIFWSLAA